MKVRMIENWSDREDHPRKDDELWVVDKVYGDDSELERYCCRWGSEIIDVYPYECQEL